MTPAVFILVLCATLVARISAECANACNGHGKCTSYDMCICNRNWQSADCSERVCQFGLAHVDTPKGDLDSSGTVTGPLFPVVDNSAVYPYGTTESFPEVEDSYHNKLIDSAHYYMECSNKGKCSRKTGECACYEGYEGVACQRASCPGTPTCSGHGVCKSIRQLAMSDNQNSYQLWDKDVTMGCSCDGGYYGADCSQRECKYGVDPLYLDDSATVKYSIYDVAIFTTGTALTDFTDGSPTSGLTGTFALRFFDNVGEDWLTTSMPVGATCKQVIAALEAIPNKVIPVGTIQCTRVVEENSLQGTGFSMNYENITAGHFYRKVYSMALWDAQAKSARDYGKTNFVSSVDANGNPTINPPITLSGYIYRLKFYGNPGAFPQPQIELNKDGNRPTTQSKTSGGRIISKVWSDGQQGEDVDYFADHCDGVRVNVKNVGKDSYLTGFNVAQKNILKVCLGSSDFNKDNNVDVYNWDYGDKNYPHLIKLVRTVTTYMDGGYYAALYYDPLSTLDGISVGAFRLLNPFVAPDRLLTDEYEVYTTKGTFAITSNLSEATFGFADKRFYTTNTSFEINPFGNPYDGDISCTASAANPGKFNFIQNCLNTSDLFTFLSWDNPHQNSPHINLYTAKRVTTLPFEHSVKDLFTANPSASLYPNPKVFSAAVQNAASTRYLTHVIDADISSNWGVSIAQHPKFHIYKFFPAVASNYVYVAPCSNRGICDASGLGTCSCFPGYTSDSCSEQSSLSL